MLVVELILDTRRRLLIYFSRTERPISMRSSASYTSVLFLEVLQV